jgi:hypothetical protein
MLAVARARVRRPAEPLAIRRALEVALGEAEERCGLPPSALMVVRRLDDPLPSAEPSSPAWSSAAAASLADLARGAARPAEGPVPAGARAVVFADRAEWLACLAADWCHGCLAERWWWAGAGDVAHEWIEHATHAPAALEALAVERLDERFAARLEPAAAAGLVAAIGTSHAEAPPVLGGPRTAGAARAAVAGRPMAPAAARSASGGPEDPRPPAAAVRPARPSRLHREPRELHAAPPAPRGAPAAGGGDLSAPAVAGPRQGETPSAPPPSRGPGPSPRPVAAAAEPPLAGPASHARGPVTDARGGAGAPAARVRRVAAEREAARDAQAAPPTAGAAAAGAHVEAASHAPPLAAADARAGPPLPPQAAPPAPAPPATPDEPVPPALPARRGHLPSSPRPGGPGRPAARSAVAPAARPPKTHAPPAAVEPPAADDGPGAPLARRVASGHAGAFFTVNLLLALGLYPDFTRPRDPGPGLDLWDAVALVSEALAGAAVVDDPVWALLAVLAGREPGEAPSWEGVAPPRGWTAPASLIDPALPPVGAGDGWAERMLEHLRRAVGRALEASPRTLVAVAGDVFLTEVHIDVVIPLARLPIAIRIAGLDRDPGWLPSARRELRFHFR